MNAAASIEFVCETVGNTTLIASRTDSNHDWTIAFLGLEEAPIDTVDKRHTGREVSAAMLRFLAGIQ